MAGFTGLIFISYAHADNRDGWVDAFHASLENWLGVNGVTAQIWRDKKLGGADVFSDEILAQLRRSALLISILSPNGMKSNWCEKERQKFEQYAEGNGGFRIGNVVRAVKVVRTPADQDAHRPIFGTVGYEFFEENRQTGLYDHYLPSETKFEKKIDQLAQEIKGIFQALSTCDPLPAKPAVYVADVSSDLDPDRAKIADQLKAWGYHVVPAQPLSINSPSLRPTIESALREAALSVHLLSHKRGAIPDEEERSILALQYELANARGLERVVWVLPGAQPDPSVDAAIQAGSSFGLERLEGQKTIEDLKEILAAKLKGIDERTRATSNGAPKLNVYVVCERGDLDRALTLKSFLDSCGYSVWVPPATQIEPHEQDEDLRLTLDMSDAVILYWGGAGELWFRKALRELINARTPSRRGRPFVAEALYLTSPPLDEKNLYRSHLDLVFEQTNGFQTETLRPFLDRLSRVSGTAAP